MAHRLPDGEDAGARDMRRAIGLARRSFGYAEPYYSVDAASVVEEPSLWVDEGGRHDNVPAEGLSSVRG
jgi:hypothetical protein